MANELDELFALTNEASRQQFQQFLDSNPVLKERVEAQSALFAALSAGDNEAIDAASKKFGNKQQTVEPPVRREQQQSQPVDGLDMLNKMLDNPEFEKRVSRVFESRRNSKDEDERINVLATKKAQELFDAEAPKFQARTLKMADDIYSIRRQHEKEFGKELDSAELDKFMTENPNRFATLADAHDAYVSKERIANEIKKGVDAELSKRVDQDVPGRTITSTQSNITPLPKMLEFNQKLTDPANLGTPRGVGIDAAVKAWRELQARNSG